MSENPKVFISYSHEDALFEQTVLNFTNKLRSEGIDANIDLYEEVPAEGWPRWMDNQIRIADYVLVVCTKSYFEISTGSVKSPISIKPLSIFSLISSAFALYKLY